MNTQKPQPQKRFKIRAMNINTGKIVTELLTKHQIAEGFEDKDLNIEDIGIALLNDLRETMGLEPIVAAMDDDEDPYEDEDEE